ncbi:membrane protein [Sulfobacillus acidophilus TPY]|nr:membrane protein [Sulfobacillus acidophilus TPY]
MAVALAGAIWMLRSPRHAWWGVVTASVALEVIHHWDPGVGQYAPVVGVVTGIILAYVLQPEVWQFIRRHRAHYGPFALYTLMVWIAAATSIHHSTSLRYAVGVPAVLFVTAVVLPYLWQKRQLTQEAWLVPLAWTGLLATLVAGGAALGFHQGFLVPVGRHHLLAWEWPFANKNTLGMLLVFSVPASLALSLDASDYRQQRVYALFFVIMLAGLLMSYARTAWIAAVVGSVLLIIARWRGRGVLAVLVGGLILGGGAVAVTGLSRWEHLWQHGLTGRTGLWRAAWTVFRQHPWFGVGPGNSPRALLPYVPPAYAGLTPHDAVLRTAVELGGFGLLVWGWLVVTALYHVVIQERSWPSRVWAALLLAALVEQTAESIFLGGVFFGDFFFTALIGIAWLWPSLSREEGRRYRRISSGVINR